MLIFSSFLNILLWQYFSILAIRRDKNLAKIDVGYFKWNKFHCRLGSSNGDSTMLSL